VSLKFFEVVILLIAGCLFVVWQMRDLRLAREKTRLEREAKERERAEPPDTPGDPHAP
jgi:hypothetical protein